MMETSRTEMDGAGLAPPADLAEAERRCAAASLPDPVLAVVRRLQGAGFAALLVGGAVRDCLLGRAVGDWDVATSATPAQIMEVFERTIPTGVEHGTVTVLIGRGDDRVAVEVTTFRGDVAYEDGRRPAAVRFLTDVREDLARRDFTINAFAWDPVASRLFDEFEGLADLQAGRVRAVGAARARFEEDGLRPMRGVRFCATLGFSLEPETEEAIGQTLSVFDRVARERVRVELFKLLGAKAPGSALEAMRRTGLWDRIFPPIEEAPRDDALATFAAVEAAPRDAVIRLSMILRRLCADSGARATSLDGLKLSRADRRRCDVLTGEHVTALSRANTPLDWRRAASGVGRALLEDACEVLSIPSAEKDAIRWPCATVR